MSPEINWTHPSVQMMLAENGASDPLAEISRRARGVALLAMEEGWPGPPYDPFALAERLGIVVIPRDGLEDARLIATDHGTRVEFNPNRRPARVRFSVAHEIAHSLFSDFAARPRYRSHSHSAEVRRPDDWQLEVLCNVAAAEFLMPAGAFAISQADDLRLANLLDLRARYEVSTEALLRRVLRLTDRPACMFACARLPNQFRVDYAVASRAWKGAIRPGSRLPAESVLAHCTAVGYSVDDYEQWPGIDASLHVQAVGIPPYPGDQFPRVIGLLEPAEGGSSVEGVRMVRGDATRPQRDGPTVVAHIVNDRARQWGGHGFAAALGRRIPEARRLYAEWSMETDNRRLGAVQISQVDEDLWVASMVAQAGYGETKAGQSRLRLPALASCLEVLQSEAQRLGASIHMPAIGTGQGATSWPTIRDLILETLVDAGIPVTVYVLPSESMPEEQPAGEQMMLA